MTRLADWVRTIATALADRIGDLVVTQRSAARAKRRQNGATR